MRIGVFGGSFNPIHNGHVALARALLPLARLDRVLFVVSPHNPLKDAGGLLCDRTRMEMVSAALAREDRLVACDVEFGLPRPSYAWNTLEALSSAYPGDELVLIMGGDNWEVFPRWHAHERILARYGIVVYPRPGSPVDAGALPDGVTLVDAGLMDVSGTQVRRMLSLGEDVRALVPAAALDIIRERGLYRGAGGAGDPGRTA